MGGSPEIPRAVASGVASSPSPDAVRAGRVGVVVALLAAAVVSAVFAVREVPAGAIALVGGPARGVARYGGITATWVPPAGAAPRLDAADASVIVHRDGDRYTIELPGVTETDAPDVIARLSAGGDLQMREVIESDDAAGVARLGFACSARCAAGDQPSLEVDPWRAEIGGESHRDMYLLAPSRRELAAAFDAAATRGWAPPPHTEIVYELVPAAFGAKDTRDMWRSYFVSDEVAIDSAAIADAYGTYDPNTNRPVVLLEFNRAGGSAFGELTARIAGHKLATLLGGVVRSAPVINEPIRGGRASITMGSRGDPAQQEHERDVLVDVLRAGELGLGGQISDARWVRAEGGPGLALARAVLALAAGAVGFLLAFALVRATRPERRRTVLLAGTAPRKLGRAIAWTLLGIAVYVAGTYITVPGLNEYELAFTVTRGRGGFDFTTVSIFALGIMPLVTSYVVIEVVASLVPRWRRARDTIRGRSKLDFAVMLGGALVAAVQAYFVTTYFVGLDRGNGYLFDHALFWAAVAALAAGPLFLGSIAQMISRRGLGNGYAVLIVFSWLWSIPWFDLPEGAALGLAVAVIVATAITACVVLGWRVRAPGRVAVPLPAAGVAPFHDGGGVVGVLGALLALGVVLPPELADTAMSMQRSTLVGLSVLAVSTVGWAFAFARPGRRRAELAAAKLQPTDRALWARATLLTAGALAALYALALARPSGVLGKLSDPALVVVACAAFADLLADVRARRADLVAVWPLHDPLLADAARDVLGDIPCHIQSTRLRALLWIFGAYVPMLVYVPAPHAADAHARMRAWLDPA